ADIIGVLTHLRSPFSPARVAVRALPPIVTFSSKFRLCAAIRSTRGMIRKKLGRNKKNRCRFCTKEGCPRPAFVDYKDVTNLKKMCSGQGKLFSRKRSGTCATYQRALSA